MSAMVLVGMRMAFCTMLTPTVWSKFSHLSLTASSVRDAYTSAVPPPGTMPSSAQGGGEWVYVNVYVCVCVSPRGWVGGWAGVRCDGKLGWRVGVRV